MDGGQIHDGSDGANCKGQIVLTMRGERRLRCIVHSQRSQTLAQITIQLNDCASRTIRKRALCNALFSVWVLGAVDLPEYHCSMLAIRLHVLPGQDNTENPDDHWKQVVFKVS
ncbi:uncharacterized protein TNCV_2308801 [Trichonephila clavipes]|nr:uncharacterized protein TNCV_2308801 [Trichonephila clavipes]